MNHLSCRRANEVHFIFRFYIRGDGPSSKSCFRNEILASNFRQQRGHFLPKQRWLERTPHTDELQYSVLVFDRCGSEQHCALEM